MSSLFNLFGSPDKDKERAQPNDQKENETQKSEEIPKTSPPTKRLSLFGSLMSKDESVPPEQDQNEVKNENVPEENEDTPKTSPTKRFSLFGFTVPSEEYQNKKEQSKKPENEDVKEITTVESEDTTLKTISKRFSLLETLFGKDESGPLEDKDQNIEQESKPESEKTDTTEEVESEKPEGEKPEGEKPNTITKRFSLFGSSKRASANLEDKEETKPDQEQPKEDNVTQGSEDKPKVATKRFSLFGSKKKTTSADVEIVEKDDKEQAKLDLSLIHI